MVWSSRRYSTMGISHPPKITCSHEYFHSVDMDLLVNQTVARKYFPQYYSYQGYWYHLVNRVHQKNDTRCMYPNHIWLWVSKISSLIYLVTINKETIVILYLIVRNQTNDNTVDLPRCCPASFVGQFAQAKCLQSQDAKHPGKPLLFIFSRHLSFSESMGQQFK